MFFFNKTAYFKWKENHVGNPLKGKTKHGTLIKLIPANFDRTYVLTLVIFDEESGQLGIQEWEIPKCLIAHFLRVW